MQFILFSLRPNEVLFKLKETWEMNSFLGIKIIEIETKEIDFNLQRTWRDMNHFQILKFANHIKKTFHKNLKFLETFKLTINDRFFHVRTDLIDIQELMI